MAVEFGEAFRVWLKIGCLGFGGPAGQIALMHRILVDEKKWVEEERYLHALNFCMLLPGPEAQKLATYVGWLLHGTRGGLAAGILFVLPGALVMLASACSTRSGRASRLVDGALFGIKAAVLVIVVEALIRIGRRGLKTRLLVGARRGGLRRHLLLRCCRSRSSSLPPARRLLHHAKGDHFGLRRADIAGAWAPGAARAIAGRPRAVVAPVALVVLALGTHTCSSTSALFFSKLAVVSFGGAYALLAYMAQQAVETYGWMSAPEMVDGLGLRRDAARAAHQGDAVRRLPRRLPRCRRRSRRWPPACSARR